MFGSGGKKRANASSASRTRPLSIYSDCQRTETLHDEKTAERLHKSPHWRSSVLPHFRSDAAGALCFCYGPLALPGRARRDERVRATSDRSCGRAQTFLRNGHRCRWLKDKTEGLGAPMQVVDYPRTITDRTRCCAFLMVEAYHCPQCSLAVVRLPLAISFKKTISDGVDPDAERQPGRNGPAADQARIGPTDPGTPFAP
jgi:hypothetical protein